MNIYNYISFVYHIAEIVQDITLSKTIPAYRAHAGYLKAENAGVRNQNSQ
jgi:hypothetical protein